MATTSSYYYSQHGRSLPVNVPGEKQHHSHGVSVVGSNGDLRGAPGQHSRPRSSYSQYSASPPEGHETDSTTSPDHVFSSGSSQYSGSEDDGSGVTSVDLLDYMDGRLYKTYDPQRMDESLVRQAQMSGELNAKNRELAELQAKARARLARTRSRFSEGMKTAREVQRDLEWTSKKIQTLNVRAAARYPEQYRAARERYPSDSDD